MDSPTPEQIAAYIEEHADSIMVRVRLGCAWEDISIHSLRFRDPDEAARAVGRLMERGCYPHLRVKAIVL